MKKNLVLLTGIVFFIALLVAGSCSRSAAPVRINCNAVEDGGELKFTMWDAEDTVVAVLSSKDPTKLVADLTTIVQPGTVVFWEWDEDSEVKVFVNVAPPALGNIIDIPPTAVNDSKKFRHVIPGNAKPGQESYYIEFIWKEETVKIDPHLKVPDQDSL